MIVQIIGWFSLVCGCIGYTACSWTKDKQAVRDTIRTATLFLICAAICFK